MVPYEQNRAGGSDWVQYPTGYAFRGFGKVRDKPERYYEARKVAIEVIDAHLDGFMERRKLSFESMAQSADHYTISDIRGKLAVDADRHFLHDIIKSASKADPPRPPEWVNGATVVKIETNVYLEETLSGGSILDIALP